MAEKGFGVKEVNLIGPSGTPTITSPNNLNLNAVNVAISTNVSIGGTLSVTGNVSIGGTLTYEDVTNIDSVGLVTAREGVFIPDNKELKIGNTAGSPDTKIFSNGNKTRLVSTIQYDMDADIIDIHNASANSMKARFLNNPVELYYANNKKFETTSSGATVTGTLVATTFSGSGASLTSLPAANLTGTLPAISGANLTNLPVTDPSNSDIQVVYTVTANGSSAYRFAGNGVVSTANNPDLYLIRGKKYRFVNNSGGSHPFQIREASGGTAYSTGVTNNGAASGNIDFAPTFDSPAQLVYQCTSHGGMVGNIYLRGAAGNENNVGVVTASSFESTTFSKTPTNTPAFHAFRNGSFSPTIADQTTTKMTMFTTETLDTDSAYDNSSSGTTANRFTVPAGKGGYYQVAAGLNFYADSNDMKHAKLMIYKNGSIAISAYGFVSSYAAGTRHLQCDIAGMLNLNASDYLEVYAYLDTNGGSGGYISNDSQGLRGNYFSAFKLII